MPSNLRLNHPRRLVYGAIWRVPIKIADRCWSMHEHAFATFLAPVTSTLIRWPSYTNLIRISCRYTGCAYAKKNKKNCMSKISKVIVWQTDIHTYGQTDRQTDMPSKLYTTPLREWSIRSMVKTATNQNGESQNGDTKTATIQNGDRLRET